MGGQALVLMSGPDGTGIARRGGLYVHQALRMVLDDAWPALKWGSSPESLILIVLILLVCPGVDVYSPASGL